MKSTFRQQLKTVTAREREVWALIASGKTDRETGAHLGIHFTTVKNHRASISKKMGARNTADLTRFAIKAGLVRV